MDRKLHPPIKLQVSWRETRRENRTYFAKKASSAEVKEEVIPKILDAKKSTVIDPVDEISLTEISEEIQEEALTSDLFIIVGE